MASVEFVLLDDLCKSAVIDRRTAEEILASSAIHSRVRKGRIALTKRSAARLLPLLKRAAKQRDDRRRPMMALPQLTCVYFIKDGGFVKIGVAGNALKRMADLQVANPRLLSLLFVIDGGYAEENRLHARFATHHERGDWFRIEGDLAAFLEARTHDRDTDRHEGPTHSGLEAFFEAAIADIYSAKTDT